jgi:ribokinase
MKLRSTAKIMSPPVIAVVGGLNMDMVFQAERLPDAGESMDGTSLTDLPGGKGANTALATYRASHLKPSPDKKDDRGAVPDDTSENNVHVYMNGAVGNDDFGKTLRKRLEQNGVDVTGVRTINGERSGTCVVVVELDTKESRNVAWQGANLKWTPKNDDVECLAGGHKADLVITHLGIPRDQAARVLATAKLKGVDTLLNPSPALYLTEEYYRNLTHLVMNQTECGLLSTVHEPRDEAGWSKAADEFINKGVKNVIITLSERGAYYATNEGKCGIVDAVKDVEVMDTTGAG